MIMSEAYCTTSQFQEKERKKRAILEQLFGKPVPSAEEIRAGQEQAGPAEHLHDRYHRHCGPTAITNLLLTTAMRRKERGQLPQETQKIFDRVAQIGNRRLVYINLDLFHRFGGTSDALAGLYLRRCFREYRMKPPELRFQLFPTEGSVTQALERGSVLYLQVRGHSKYGNHHMLCYGREEQPDGAPAKYRIADGWVPRPVRLTFKELERFRLLEVRIGK